MKKLIKYAVTVTVKPLLEKYLSVTRIYQYKGIRLSIPPTVFHPAFFFSTKLLLKYISALSLQGKKFLELGAGSGLIAFTAAKKGASVTATDINATAVEYLHKNSAANKVPVQIYLSNLFNNIPLQVFDIIVINPPYYKKQPVTEAQYAWYCGPNGEYFSTLFQQLDHYTYKGSLVLMILSEDCDLEMITGIAKKHDFYFKMMYKKSVYWEMNLIYQILHISPAV